SASATHDDACTSSNAVSGCAWIRCDSSMISSRADSTASASRRFASAWGGAGSASRPASTSDWVGTVTWPPGTGAVANARRSRDERRSAIGVSAVDRQGDLEDHDQRDDEQDDGRLEDLLDAQDHGGARDDRDPEPTADGGRPIAQGGGPAGTGET